MCCPVAVGLSVRLSGSLGGGRPLSGSGRRDGQLRGPPQASELVLGCGEKGAAQGAEQIAPLDESLAVAAPGPGPEGDEPQGVERVAGDAAQHLEYEHAARVANPRVVVLAPSLPICVRHRGAKSLGYEGKQEFSGAHGGERQHEARP